MRHESHSVGRVAGLDWGAEATTLAVVSAPSTHSSTSVPSARLTTTVKRHEFVGEAGAVSAAPVRARLRRGAAPASAGIGPTGVQRARFLGRRRAQLAGVAVLDDDLRVGAGASDTSVAAAAAGLDCATADIDAPSATATAPRPIAPARSGFMNSNMSFLRLGSSSARPLVADEREGMDQQRAARRRFSTPRPARPASMSAQVSGSGTATANVSTPT